MTGALPADVEQFLQRHASGDVYAAVRWLLDHAWEFDATNGGDRRLSGFGSVFVFVGAGTTVTVSVDRGQWLLEIQPTVGAPSYQLDLLIVAQQERPYWECFPATDPAPSALVPQLPPGIAWRDTLPEVLAWLGQQATAVESAVKLARDQRFAVMWPDSASSTKLRRSWHVQGMPTPP